MQIRFERNRTSTVIVMYSLYLYFLGLSVRNTSKALVIFKDEKNKLWLCLELDSEIWSYPIYKSKNVAAFIIDETVIYNSDSQHFWL